MTDELFGYSSDDPGLTKARRQALERLASGKAGPALAEMARELLSGRTTPAQLMASGAYDEELGRHVSRFSSWFGGLSDQQKEDVAKAGLRKLDWRVTSCVRRNPQRGHPVEDTEMMRTKMMSSPVSNGNDNGGSTGEEGRMTHSEEPSDRSAGRRRRAKPVINRSSSTHDKLVAGLRNDVLLAIVLVAATVLIGVAGLTAQRLGLFSSAAPPVSSETVQIPPERAEPPVRPQPLPPTVDCQYPVGGSPRPNR